MSTRVGRLGMPGFGRSAEWSASSVADRRMAGILVGLVGCGVVLCAAGAATLSIPFLVAGGMLAGVGIVALMTPRWVEPAVVAALVAPLPAVWSGGGLRIAGAAPITASVVAAWALYRGIARRPIATGTLPLKTLRLLALLFLVAAAASPHPGAALRKVVNIAVLGGLLFALTDLLAHAPALRARVAAVVAGVGSACGALAVLETVGVIPGAFPRWGTPFNRAALGFGQPNGLGLYLAVVLPLVAWRASTATGSARWLWRGGLAATAAGLLATFSRGSWGAVVFGVGALALAGDWRRSVRLMGGVLLAALVLDLVSGGMVRDRITETVGDWTVEQRGALMLAGVLMFLDRPLLGFGPGGYEAELDRFGIQVPQLWDFEATPHNAYIQMGAETGFVGVILYVALLALMIRAAARTARARASSAALDRALLWSLGAVAIAGFFIWPFALDTGEAVIVLFALVASAPAPDPPLGAAPPGRLAAGHPSWTATPLP